MVNEINNVLPTSSARHVAAHGGLVGHHLEVIAPVASTDI